MLAVTEQPRMTALHGRTWEREAVFLLAASRTAPSADVVARLRQLADEGLDWDVLIALAGGHAVVPLLYRTVRDHVADLVPAAALDELARQFHIQSHFTLLLLEESRGLTADLVDAGVRPLFFKGPSLAAFAYGSVALRSCSDLDVLVAPGAFEAARRVLRARSYRPEIGLGPLRRRGFLFIHGWYPFILGDRRLMVDLHTSLSARKFVSPPDFDRLWADGMDVRVGETEQRTPGPADLLNLLAVHGAKHFWLALRWVCDVAELLHRCPDLDWDAVLRRAEANRSRRVLRLTLFMTRSLLGAALPKALVEETWADRRVVAQGERLLETFFPRSDGPVGRLHQLAYHLDLFDDAYSRARFLGYTVLSGVTKPLLGLLGTEPGP